MRLQLHSQGILSMVNIPTVRQNMEKIQIKVVKLTEQHIIKLFSIAEGVSYKIS